MSSKPTAIVLKGAIGMLFKSRQPTIKSCDPKFQASLPFSSNVEKLGVE